MAPSTLAVDDMRSFFKSTKRTSGEALSSPKKRPKLADVPEVVPTFAEAQDEYPSIQPPRFILKFLNGQAVPTTVDLSKLREGTKVALEKNEKLIIPKDFIKFSPFFHAMKKNYPDYFLEIYRRRRNSKGWTTAGLHVIGDASFYHQTRDEDVFPHGRHCKFSSSRPQYSVMLKSDELSYRGC